MKKENLTGLTPSGSAALHRARLKTAITNHLVRIPAGDPPTDHVIVQILEQAERQLAEVRRRVEEGEL